MALDCNELIYKSIKFQYYTCNLQTSHVFENACQLMKKKKRSEKNLWSAKRYTSITKIHKSNIKRKIIITTMIKSIQIRYFRSFIPSRPALPSASRASTSHSDSIGKADKQASTNKTLCVYTYAYVIYLDKICHLFVMPFRTYVIWIQSFWLSVCKCVRCCCCACAFSKMMAKYKMELPRIIF